MNTPSHWKTTAAGFVAAFFGFVAMNPHYFEAVPVLITIAKFASMGGLAMFGIVSADKDAGK